MGSVELIDCHYVRPGRAAVYLLVEEGQAAFVDTNTTRALPRLLQALERRGLKPEQVRYVVVTHVHLDHAGGTAAVLEACPNAAALAHPRAVRHLADPARLVESAKIVYGESRFADLHGTIAAAPESRLRAVSDGECIPLGKETLTLLHTAGHAKHHICVHYSGAKAVFTGDAFGVSYPALQRGSLPVLFCSSAPTDFDPEEARKTARRLVDTGAQRAYVTHFGPVEDVDAAARSLLWSINAMEGVLNEAVASQATGEALEAFCIERVQRAFDAQLGYCGIRKSGSDQQWLESDVHLNARGLAFVAQRLRSA